MFLNAFQNRQSQRRTGMLDTQKTFSAIFFAHPIAQVFRSLKLQGLRVRISAEAQLLCYFNFPIFKNSIKQLLQHDEINIVKDF